MATPTPLCRAMARLALTRPTPSPQLRLQRPKLPTTGNDSLPSTSRHLSTSPTLSKGHPRQGTPHPSTTPDHLTKTAPIPSPNPNHLPSSKTPAYPYGPRPTYKRANRGLYGYSSIMFGNRVSDRNEIKTRRNWRPNVQRKRLWSASMRCFVQTMVTTRVLRTIDKVGGLDEYLLGGKSARIKDLGVWGWKLRWRIMQTNDVRERFRLERERIAAGQPVVHLGRVTGGDGVGVVAESNAGLEQVQGKVDGDVAAAELTGWSDEVASEQPSQQALTEMQEMLDKGKEFPLYDEAALEKEARARR